MLSNVRNMDFLKLWDTILSAFLISESTTRGPQINLCKPVAKSVASVQFLAWNVDQFQSTCIQKTVFDAQLGLKCTVMFFFLFCALTGPDCLVLLVYKDKSDKVQGNKERLSTTLEEICGLEVGQWNEAVVFTLAVLCLTQTTLLGFDSKEALLAWEARLRYSLGEGEQNSACWRFQLAL